MEHKQMKDIQTCMHEPQNTFCTHATCTVTKYYGIMNNINRYNLHYRTNHTKDNHMVLCSAVLAVNTTVCIIS